MAVFGFCAFTASAGDNPVRAKIGIQISSGGAVEKAKSRDTLGTGDLLRIYVHPEANAYVYVVHSDLAEATLLNMVEQKIKSSTLVMPSLLDYYQVDGKSLQETFTIICSPVALSQMAGIVKNRSLPHAQWVKIENGLVQQSKIELSGNTEKPFALAGNVRDAGSAGNSDPFAGGLQIFSGKGVLVKKYEFAVKKK
jgi:transposase-like protein